MGKFLYRSVNVLPSGKIWVQYTRNPETAEKLGGVLTCRSRSGMVLSAKQSYSPIKNKQTDGKISIPTSIRYPIFSLPSLSS